MNRKPDSTGSEKSPSGSTLSCRTLLRNSAAMAAIWALSPITSAKEPNPTQQEDSMTRTGSKQQGGNQAADNAIRPRSAVAKSAA